MRGILVLLAGVAGLAACAGPRVLPAVSPATASRDALLVLPGFGYGRGDGDAFRALAKTAHASGIDMYVPAYIGRGGLDEARRNLRGFVHAQRLDRYARVHVIAFIAGAWTVNPMIDHGELPNLKTVIYDRSPFQERAPMMAVRDLRIAAWLRYGRTIFDLARTPYPALARGDVRVGLLVETAPTAFVRAHARPSDVPRAEAFACAEMGERFDDCVHLPMSHDDLYVRFAEVWPEVESFIRAGHFTGRPE